MTRTNPVTQNREWGFFGTMMQAGYNAFEAWDAASAAIADAIDDHEGYYAPEGIRDFLDSRHGRHFADTVASNVNTGQTFEAALTAAIAQWQGWKIGPRLYREEGIPAGLPYLTGWVQHFAILNEAA
ncbi:MAG: hypothetical protein J0H79_15470 [Alphaproteobacteria bacterium]|nr:hypothetical protein [Alphaproteobacteria bacterium]